ncbi:response regulator [Pseudoalteromonas sp.]|uniref:response regulator n=1 Tax=Pseudoalteromonas sp. TaxID=53249 RepID=UPI003565120E
MNNRVAENDMDILIVDDYPLMCQLIKDSLADMNGKFLIRYNYKTAKALLKITPIDLTIIDLNLYEASGLELIKMIRTGQAKCQYNLPIMVITGNADRANILECKNFAVNAIITKPLSPLVLKERVKQVLSEPSKLASIEHYQNLLTTDRQQYTEASKVKIIFDQQDEQQIVSAKLMRGDDLANKTKNANAIITMPNGPGTGLYPIDIRLEKLCFAFNDYFFSIDRKASLGYILKAEHTIAMLVDDLSYIAKKRIGTSGSSEVLEALIHRLADFKRLGLDGQADKAHKQRGLAKQQQCKAFWLRLTSKPIFHVGD